MTTQETTVTRWGGKLYDYRRFREADVDAEFTERVNRLLANVSIDTAIRVCSSSEGNVWRESMFDFIEERHRKATNEASCFSDGERCE